MVGCKSPLCHHVAFLPPFLGGVMKEISRVFGLIWIETIMMKLNGVDTEKMECLLSQLEVLYKREKTQ